MDSLPRVDSGPHELTERQLLWKYRMLASYNHEFSPVRGFMHGYILDNLTKALEEKDAMKPLMRVLE